MIELRLLLPPLSAARNSGLDGVLSAFYTEAGHLIVSAIQDLLGTDRVYTLDPGYAARKPSLPNYVHVPGKSSHQPLIKTAEMYYAVEWRIDGDKLVVQVADGKGIDKYGYDYAEHWEAVTHFLETALADIEPLLLHMFEAVLVREMGTLFA